MRNKLAFMIVMLLLALPASFVWAGPCGEGVPCLDPYEPGKGANDSKTSNPTCDGDFMNQIYARAYMEADRKLVTTQSVVRRPDSVLQYTCFDQVASVAADKAGEIFSDSSEWHDIRINVAVTESGFLGQAFLDSIAGFADGLISDLLQGLLPEDLLNVLSQLDNIMNLNPQDLLQSLTNLAADEIVNTLNNLSVEVQMQIRSRILDMVPPDVLSLISSNPGSASTQELLIGLQGLPSEVVINVFADLPADQLGDILSILPSRTLYELPPGYISARISAYSPAQTALFLNHLSPHAIESMGQGAIANALAGISPSVRAQIFSSMGPDVMVGFMASMSSSDLNKILGGMSSQMQASLRANIVASLPPEVMDLISNNPLTDSIQDLMGGLQLLDPAQLNALISNMTAAAFDQLLNALGLDQLGGLLGGGGSSPIVQFDVFMGEDNMDRSVETVVLDSMKNYTDANFAGPLLGGTADTSYEMSNTVTDGGYNCTVMQDVWQLSKCQNFDGTGNPGFQTFDDLQNNDPRQYPQACGGTMISQEMQDVATNKDGKAVKYDSIEDTYVDRLGGKADGAIVCGDPVPVGKKVPVKKVTESSDLNGGAPNVTTEWVEEMTCSNPACVYQDGKCVAK